ncbi:MAG TPA: MOSC domain-containing protein [Planctomycetota bacterium]|nr:MOSC domain-containing protein [Planctomycetota bacterium]
MAVVIAVSRSAVHGFTKPTVDRVVLVAGHGVEGDAHAGATVRHRWQVAKDPGAPNLRQVHLMHAELHDELRLRGFAIGPGAMGENITTRGIELLALPLGTRLRLGVEAVIEITGLRSPCAQLDRVQKGLMKAVLDRDSSGRVVHKAGVMAIVVAGGPVVAGDRISVELPAAPHRALAPV